MPHNELRVGPKEPDNEEFGELLQQFRLQKGLTRAQAAERVGFTSEYLRLIERGKRTPSFAHMALIFGVYDVYYVTDGIRQFIIDETSIEFTSRIREARIKEAPPIVVEANRSQQIGQIIDLLVQADESKLRKVYRILRSD